MRPKQPDPGANPRSRHSFDAPEPPVRQSGKGSAPGLTSQRKHEAHKRGETGVPFRPVHGDHAILEVVFQVTLDRPLLRPDIQALVARHPELSDDLPSVRVTEQVQPVVDAAGGDVFISLPVPGQGPPSTPVLEFSAFRRDGNIEWRLQCAGPLVTVNCTAYTRWERVWGRAQRYLSLVLGHPLDGEPRRVQRLLLQYIDLFTWQGARGDYRIGELVDLSSPLVPASLRDRGRIWHLHQGWFTPPREIAPDMPDPVPAGRLLERFHVDSVEGMVVGQSTPNLSVRIDNLIRYDLETEEKAPALLEDRGAGAICFEVMHQLNKRRLGEFLTEAAAKGIGLRA